MMRSAAKFPAVYEVRVLDEQAADGVAYVFGRDGQPEAGVDLLIEVTPGGGPPWVGAVRRAPPTVKGALTDAHSTPNLRRVCVVAGGDAYLIDVDRPDAFEALDTGGPVVAVHALVSEGVLLLASPWVVTAIDRNGRAWQTGRLAIDGVRLDESKDGRLVGVADPDDDEPREFVIDLRTGFHEGGVPFH